MNMSVTDGLPCCFAVIDADVEPGHQKVLPYYLGSTFIQKLINRAPLRLEQIEESQNVSLRYDECMELCHRVFITYRKC